ncbi:MAG: hypothetical protein KA586_11235 [Candidatus Promineofilum sp.]|nr:hypothetical protein [Promineifilum sp.]
MNAPHRWSSLYRGYDVTLRHNQLILVATAVGMGTGFLAAEPGLTTRLVAAAVTGAVAFMAGALAKELNPDGAWGALGATVLAVLAVPIAGLPTLPSAVALFWLLGNVRFLNRTSGLPPKLTDAFALLALSAWLGWQVTPFFGILMGITLLLDNWLPDGRRIYAMIGMMGFLVSAVWLAFAAHVAGPLSFWMVAVLLTIAAGSIPMILSTYRVQAVGDVTSLRLSPARVQAGQVLALGSGLFLATWLGEPGIVLLLGLWAALLATLASYLFAGRWRPSAGPR